MGLLRIGAGIIPAIAGIIRRSLYTRLLSLLVKEKSTITRGFELEIALFVLKVVHFCKVLVHFWSKVIKSGPLL